MSPDGALSALGFVLISPDHKSFCVVDGSLRTQDGTVLVDVTGPNRPDGALAMLDLQVTINGQVKTYREASDGSWVSSA